MSSDSKQRKHTMLLFRLFHHQDDKNSIKKHYDLSVLNDLAEPSLPQMPGHSFNDEMEEQSGEYASEFNSRRQDPVTISVVDVGKNHADSSRYNSWKCAVEQEQPQSAEYGKRVDNNRGKHENGSTRFTKKEDDSSPMCCGMSSYMVGGMIILVTVVLVGMVTAIGFVVVRRSSSSNSNSNNVDTGDVPFSSSAAIPTTRQCTSTRCGFTWSLANSQCNNDCVMDEDCAAGQLCFVSLTTSGLYCCDDGNGFYIDITDMEPELCTSTRCGTTRTMANSNCGTNCLTNEDCTEE
jgi:hypothetical protein